MDLFRIARGKYIHNLKGEGARFYGGRWNRKGVPVLYTSSSISLAAMEILANTPMESLPDDLQVLILSVPDKIRPEKIEVDELPGNWRDWPAPEKLKNIGSKWIQSQSSLLLYVPSSVIPMERNVLINPLHPEFKKVREKGVSNFRFDERLHHS